MALQGERKQEKVTDPVPWKAASAVPAEIEVGKQGFVNRNSRDGHRPTIKGKAWSGPHTRKADLPPAATDRLDLLGKTAMTKR